MNADLNLDPDSQEVADVADTVTVEENCFDTERKTWKFHLMLPNESGVKEKTPFMLREMNGLGRDAYLTAISNRAKYVKGQAQGVKDFKGIHADLLTRTMVDLRTNRLVTEEFLNQHVPSSVDAKLFKKAKELCGLGDEEEEKEKND